MPALLQPEDSPTMVMLRRLVEIVEADEELRMMFGWEDPPSNPANDDPLRRKIFLDDSGTCDPEQSPKLVLTEFVQMDSFEILGDGANVDSNICAQIAVIVYSHIPRDSDGREKVLVGNLHAAVRRVIRQNVFEENGAWENSEFLGPSCLFEQSDGFRRGGGILALYGQKRIT